VFRRHRRERPLPADAVEQALGRLAALVEDAYLIAPTLVLRERRADCCAAHPLRAADALQLGGSDRLVRRRTAERAVRLAWTIGSGTPPTVKASPFCSE